MCSGLSSSQKTKLHSDQIVDDKAARFASKRPYAAVALFELDLGAFRMN
jgi:hypothetical protein